MRSSNKSLVVRADASTRMGTGHLMRCLALAQAWQDSGGSATFAMAKSAPALEARLKAEVMEVVRLSATPGSNEDAAETAKLACQRAASWVVVDGYHFGADYQRAIKDAGLNLLAIDDNGDAEHYYADIVLNQNLHAHEGLYPNHEPYTRLLLGTRYVLLRREFLKWRGWKREIPEVARKVLVTLGGADPDNVTLEVIQSLRQVHVDGLDVVVVVGGSNPHNETLQAAAQDAPFPMRLEMNVADMPGQMAWADVAVSGGGSTVWELMFMRVPSLITVVADNQVKCAEAISKEKVFPVLGHDYTDSKEAIALVLAGLLPNAGRRRQSSAAGSAVVDGLGRLRVVQALSESRVTGVSI